MKIPVIISIAMLLLALLDLPIGYYTLLRIVVCFTAAYLAYSSYETRKMGWAWTIGLIAFIFNPLIPIRFDRELWIIIDITTAIIFGMFLFREHRKQNTERRNIDKLINKFINNRDIVKYVFLAVLIIIVIGISLSTLDFITRKQYRKHVKGIVLDSESYRQQYIQVKVDRFEPLLWGEGYVYLDIANNGAKNMTLSNFSFKLYDRSGYLLGEAFENYKKISIEANEKRKERMTISGKNVSSCDYVVIDGFLALPATFHIDKSRM